MAFCFLVNGLSYTNHPPKPIAMSILLPIACGALMLLHQRFAHPFGYFWSCAK